MVIRNFCFGLKNNQINYYLSQLPNIYRTCEVPILFINRNIFGYLIFLCYAWKYNLSDRSYKEFLMVGGSSYANLASNDPIFIYCSLGKTEISKPLIVYTLFHELRHWYQQKYMNRFFNSKYHLNLCLEDDDYEKSPLEVDANKFAKIYAEKVGIRFIKKRGIDYVDIKRSKLKR